MKKGFCWGAASASYQIEGGIAEGGRTPSVWDVFSHAKGNVRYDENGDTACDSYHRFEEDLDIISELGIGCYRFSLSWSRILPNGSGEVNPEGLAYYDKVVDGCLARGITPWITIFHWDTPQVLEDRYGGFRSPEIIEDFTAYALTVCRHFSDRVKNYFIMNEPQCFLGLGYYKGIFAPGLTLSPEEYFGCWHNMLLAQSTAIKAIRKELPGLNLGLATTGEFYVPATDSERDYEAAMMKTFGIDEDTWSFSASMYLDPICKGRYPDCTGSPIEAAVTAVPEKDLEFILEKPDFIGINMYHAKRVRMDGQGKPEVLSFPPGFPRTGCKWPIVPELLKFVPKYFYQRYALPMCISENGMCSMDFVLKDGKVHDFERIEYISSHLEQLEEAAEQLPIFGYFYWSILDNFEWASGYDERFGLVYVDFETGKRTIKDSGYWYSDYIRRNKVKGV